MSLLELFCHVDDFCRWFESQQQAMLLEEVGTEGREGARRRRRKGNLSLSEVMTIVILFHQSHYRDFKHFYQEHVQAHLRKEFPNLVSYTRFVELMPRSVTPLAIYLYACLGQCTAISFVDSTPLEVCRQQRARTNHVFVGLAARGKTSMGWFFGFKLHLVVNDRGEILACTLTPGDTDDRTPVPQLAKHLFGKLFGDKGYLSQKLREQLRLDPGVELLTFLRRNMQGRLARMADVLLLRKRAIIETINDQLKNISQIEHTRHRSPTNFTVNLLAGLIAYCHQPKKPSINLGNSVALIIA